jgi:hypothetical protein
VPEAYRPKTFDEQTVDLAPADKDALARNRQGYAVFPMVRCLLWLCCTVAGTQVQLCAVVLCVLLLLKVLCGVLHHGAAVFLHWGDAPLAWLLLYAVIFQWCVNDDRHAAFV